MRTDIGRSFGPDDPPDVIRRALLNTHVRSLQTTAELLDIAAIIRVAQKIAEAGHVGRDDVRNAR